MMLLIWRGPTILCFARKNINLRRLFIYRGSTVCWLFLFVFTFYCSCSNDSSASTILWMWIKIMFKSKIKWAGLAVLALSFFSLLVHLFVANSSGELAHYSALASFNEDLNIGVGDRKVLLLVNAECFHLYFACLYI